MRLLRQIAAGTFAVGLLFTAGSAQAAVTSNAVGVNSLVSNALASNSLSVNALSANALAGNALAPNGLHLNGIPTTGGALSDLNGVAVEGIILPALSGR